MSERKPGLGCDREGGILNCIQAALKKLDSECTEEERVALIRLILEMEDLLREHRRQQH